MTRFEISNAGRGLVPQFPDPLLLREVLPKLNDDERILFLRQWVSEGIPFAFRDCPLIYERLRSWVGRRLDVEPRNITVIGSSRLGCSLGGGTDFGKAFSKESDLDFAIISKDLFERVVSDFEFWKRKIEAGEERFKNKYGPENLANLPRNIFRGFIDAYKIDCHPYLGHAQKVLNTQSYGRERLNGTDGCPLSSKISIRIYAEFRAFYRQLKLNLDTALSSL